MSGLRFSGRDEDCVTAKLGSTLKVPSWDRTTKSVESRCTTTQVRSKPIGTYHRYCANITDRCVDDQNTMPTALVNSVGDVRQL